MLLCCYACLAGRQVAILLPFQIFAQEKPNLTIISPREGETIFGNQTVFSFFTSNFLLGSDGYVRVFLDQEKPLIIKAQKEVPFKGLSQEKHTLIAEVVDKNYRPLSPPIKKEVSFTSVLPEEEKGIILELTPFEKEETKRSTNPLLVFFGLGGALLLLLAFKFYINSKTSKDSADQKPLS